MITAFTRLNHSIVMNRYPLWKYILIFSLVIFGFIYTVPNFFGEAPGLQIVSNKSLVKLQLQDQQTILSFLDKEKIPYTASDFNQSAQPSLHVRFANTDLQLKAKDAITKNYEQYAIAMNLMSNSPSWLSALGAKPMFLGLDLRGGVHFLLQVDMQGALRKKLDTVMNDTRLLLREKNINHNGFEKNSDNNGFSIKVDNAQVADKTINQLRERFTDLQVQFSPTNNRIEANFTLAAKKEIQSSAIKQNITTLNNRVNELGVAEPIIQQQGEQRIVVQLPGVQDTSRAKDIIGRTATLEARLVDPDTTYIEKNQTPPPGTDVYASDGRLVVFKKQVIFTGDRINNASASFDQNQNPVVSIKLDSIGGRYMRETTSQNIGKPMGIILFEKNKAEVLTVATIQGEFGSDFQITGQRSTEQAADLALLLRAGSLAAPMDIIEERTIGPSLGADNIKKGFLSLVYGFSAIAVFMIIYYALFGVISVLALSVNLLLLIALLSIIQVTLTLPGIAAIALALGMAIDSNVLINERIREELRSGVSPQTAIHSGFKHAWDTIFDSNITTLIAGFALLAFGSGPIRGFAVVHSLGILTSMISAVFFARAVVNLYYGRRKKLQSVSIGQIWKPTESNN